jgi:tRNA(fMet)-specific endonuclease VapC
VSLVLDTSVVSALMRREVVAMDHLRRLRPGDVVLCAPVAAEIAFGLGRLAEGSRRRTLLTAEYTRLRSVVPWWDWDEAAAIAFGALKVQLERAGTPVADMDVIVASVAVARACGVATMNTRDFERMPGLIVEDWRRPAS